MKNKAINKKKKKGKLVSEMKNQNKKRNTNRFVSPNRSYEKIGIFLNQIHSEFSA